MKKVLLYLASNSPFYTNLYPSIRRGFEEAGCEVRGGADLLDEDELIKEINNFKPNFVFEMNRVKSEIKNFPDNIIHICWLVDFWGRAHEELHGSNILYTWANDWVSHFQKIGVKNVYHLAPATDITIYKPAKMKTTYDFIFLGHISKNWTEEELLRKVGFQNNKILYFKKLLPYIETFVLQNKKISLSNYLIDCNIVLDDPMDKALIYDIRNRTFRQTRRKLYLDIFTQISSSIAIYGSENWSLHKEFSLFYKKYISNPHEINDVISMSKILLHDGNYPHFRTFDAMASGVVVAAAQAPEGFHSPWQKLGFIEGEDYINIDIYSKEIDMSIFKDSNLLNKIAKNATTKVLKNHLWVNRAKQVLDDVSNL